MLKTEIEKTVNSLKALNNQYLKDYKEVFKKDNLEVRSDLKPGEPIPTATGLIREDNKNMLKEIQGELKNNAIDELNKLLKKINQKKVKAPSEEELRYIELLEKRTTLNSDDIKNALSVYGDNYQLGKVLLDIASNKQIELPYIEILEDRLTEETENLINQYNNLQGHETKYTFSIDSYIASFNQDIEYLGTI